MRHMKHSFDWPDSQISISISIQEETWWPLEFLFICGSRLILGSWHGGQYALLHNSSNNPAHVGDTFQYIHRMHVVLILMVSMLTSINNMRTRHVYFLEFIILTPHFIWFDREISNEPNLSWVNYLWTKNYASHWSNSRTML